MLKLEVNKNAVNASICGKLPEILAELTIGINAIYNAMPTPDEKEMFKRALLLGLTAPNSPAFKEDAADDLRKYQPGCVLCGEANDNIVVSGLRFCRRCAGEIAQKYSNGPCVQTDDGEEG